MRITYQGEVTTHIKSSNESGVKSGIEFNDGDSKYSIRTLYIGGEYPLGTRFDVIITDEIETEGDIPETPLGAAIPE